MSFFSDLEQRIFGGRQSAPPNQVPVPATPTGRRLSGIDRILSWLTTAFRSQDPNGLTAIDLTALQPVVDVAQKGFSTDIGVWQDVPTVGFSAIMGASVAQTLVFLQADQTRVRRFMHLMYSQTPLALAAGARPTLFMAGPNGTGGTVWLRTDPAATLELGTIDLCRAPLIVPPGYVVFLFVPDRNAGDVCAVTGQVISAPAGFSLL